MKLTIKECELKDLSKLQELSIKTFEDTYGTMNTKANMNNYIEKSFNTTKIQNELTNSNSSFYFLYTDEILAGYCKVNEFDAQTDISDSESLEIERIYIVKKYHRRGLGLFLIQSLANIAIEQGKSYVWLGVWKKNIKAISFYEKNGFYIMDEHTFVLGNEEQSDFIMRKDLK